MDKKLKPWWQKFSSHSTHFTNLQKQYYVSRNSYQRRPLSVQSRTAYRDSQNHQTRKIWGTKRMAQELRSAQTVEHITRNFTDASCQRDFKLEVRFTTNAKTSSVYWKAMEHPNNCALIFHKLFTRTVLFKEQAEVGQSPTFLALSYHWGVESILRGYFGASGRWKRTKEYTGRYILERKTDT